MGEIYVAGHKGLVGSAICRRLANDGIAALVQTRSQLDLKNYEAVQRFFSSNKIDHVYLCAAKVGGIQANSEYPAEFLQENLVIQNNIIHSAWQAGVKKLLFLGSSCIYPKFAQQPIREDALLSGALEPTNEWYAIAKIAGIKMCQAYRKQYGFNAIAAMPTNLYGPGDNFDAETSHVLPALIRKFSEAKRAGKGKVTIWGTGTPRREFLYVDDLADACVFLMENYDSADIVNVGCGEDISIKELAELIASVIGFEGGLDFDTAKPDGTPRKLLDVSKMNDLGWQASVPLRDGIEKTWRWYKNSDNGN